MAKGQVRMGKIKRVRPTPKNAGEKAASKTDEAAAAVRRREAALQRERKKKKGVDKA